MKKTGLNRYVYDFIAYHAAIAVNDILYIHKCLMKKNIIRYKNFGFIKKLVVVAIKFLVVIY